MSTLRPSLEVAIIMRRERIVGDMSRWQTWHWVLEDVALKDLLPKEAGSNSGPHLLSSNDGSERWLHVGYTAELFADDASRWLEDVKNLTADSDYAPFVARDVPAQVRNTAMKKLFTDPHYNVMDRLDIYIDDYTKPDPIPESMLRQMVSAQFLNLFTDDEETEKNRRKGTKIKVGVLGMMPITPTRNPRRSLLQQ